MNNKNNQRLIKMKKRMFINIDNIIKRVKLILLMNKTIIMIQIIHKYQNLHKILL